MGETVRETVGETVREIVGEIVRETVRDSETIRTTGKINRVSG